MSVKRPTRRDEHACHIIGATGNARYASIRAGGAALGAKRRPIKKIERDGDKALGGRRFLFLSNNQLKDGVRDGGGYWGWCGTVVECVGGCFIIVFGVWGDGIRDKKNKNMMSWP
jgi:hypothetical protein